MSKEVIIYYNHLFQSLVNEGWNDDVIEELKKWRKLYDNESIKKN